MALIRTSAPRRSSARRSSGSPRTATTSSRSSTATSMRVSSTCWSARRRSPDRRASRRTQALTQEIIEEYPRSQWWIFAVENDRTMAELEAMRKQYDEAKKGLESRFLDKVEKLQRGDELPPGVMKMVKVFVAVKRKIQPGDKMAGPPRQQGRRLQDRAAGRYAVPRRRHAGRHRAEPAWRAEPHECRADPRDASRLGLRRTRQAGRRNGQCLSERPEHEPLRDKLVEIYDAKTDIDGLDDEAVVELGENLRRGVPIATPVFDGAREKDIVECWSRPVSTARGR